MSRKLFLDDIRNPPDATWTVVRSYPEFCQYLNEQGLPDVISFDHDLADEKADEKTGMHCARFMVENFGLPKEWRVHSANPAGRANIEGLFRSYMAEILNHVFAKLVR